MKVSIKPEVCERILKDVRDIDNNEAWDLLMKVRGELLEHLKNPDVISGMAGNKNSQDVRTPLEKLEAKLDKLFSKRDNIESDIEAVLNAINVLKK